MGERGGKQTCTQQPTLSQHQMPQKTLEVVISCNLMHMSNHKVLVLQVLPAVWNMQPLTACTQLNSTCTLNYLFWTTLCNIYITYYETLLLIISSCSCLSTNNVYIFTICIYNYVYIYMRLIALGVQPQVYSYSMYVCICTYVYMYENQ